MTVRADVVTIGIAGPAGPAGASGETTEPAISTYTTASLAPAAHETGIVPMAVGYRIQRITTNKPARVRLYGSTAARDADISRPINVDPIDYPTAGASPNHGVMFEAATNATYLDLTVAPNIVGQEITGSSNVGIVVDNLDTTAGAITVAIYYEKAIVL